MTKERTSAKPRQSYTQLIYDAISSSPAQKMVLMEIYEHIENKYEYFRRSGKGWKNSVRHALSASPVFNKIPVRSNRRKYEWTINKIHEDDYKFRNNPPAEEAFTFSGDNLRLPDTPPTIFHQYTPKRVKDSPPSSNFIFCGQSPVPDLEARPSSSQLTNSSCTIGVETDPCRNWIPPTRDPLSDFANLPPITLLEMVTMSNSRVDLFDTDLWSQSHK